MAAQDVFLHEWINALNQAIREGNVAELFGYPIPEFNDWRPSFSSLFEINGIQGAYARLYFDIYSAPNPIQAQSSFLWFLVASDGTRTEVAPGVFEFNKEVIELEGYNWGEIVNVSGSSISTELTEEGVEVMTSGEYLLLLCLMCSNNVPITSFNTITTAPAGASIVFDYPAYNPAQQLATPTGLYADNITSDSARVSWTAVENASGYKVEDRQAAGGGQTFPWVEAQD